MMSYLALHRSAATFYLTGREVHHITALAQDALAAELSLPQYWRLRAELGLPPADSTFFPSQVLQFMSDGEPHRAAGHDVYLFDLALNTLYLRQPAAGILCWFYDNALAHGWVADTDREAMAGQIQAALDAGVARANTADRHQPAVKAAAATIPPGTRAGWEEAIAFLRAGPGDVVTSLSVGNEFPDYRLAWDCGIWRPGVSDPDDPGEELEILWDRVSAAGQWELCMRALRARPALRWDPAARYSFGAFALDNEAGLVPFAAGGPTAAGEAEN